MNTEGNTIQLRAYTVDGWSVSLTLDVDATPQTVARLLSKIGLVADAGLLPSPAGLEAGQEKEVIATVVRRVAGDGTPIIDFYPAWGHGGEYGQHKYAHLYLNTQEDVQQFEVQSGLTLDSLPLVDGTPIKRTFGKAHPAERPVLASFAMVRTRDGEHDNGMPKYRYGYFAPKPTTLSAPPMPAVPVVPAPATTMPEVAGPVDGSISWAHDWSKAVEAAGFDRKALLAELGIKNQSELGKSDDKAAWKLLNDHIRGMEERPWYNENAKVVALVNVARKDGFIQAGEGLTSLLELVGIGVDELPKFETGKAFYTRVVEVVQNIRKAGAAE